MDKNVFLRFKWIAGSVLGLALVTITGVNVHLSLRGQIDSDYSDVMLKNIEALSTDEAPPTGAGLPQDECSDQQGYWNMALVSSGAGVNSVQCEVDGSISIFGITIIGSYKRGQPYNVSWDNWTCVTSNGNCCLANNQGVRVFP
jgi:hypothetical protein